jgi:hypothetical protein
MVKIPEYKMEVLETREDKVNKVVKWLVDGFIVLLMVLFISIVLYPHTTGFWVGRMVQGYHDGRSFKPAVPDSIRDYP